MRESDSRERLRLDMFSSIVASQIEETRREKWDRISTGERALWFEGVQKWLQKSSQVPLTNRDEDQRSEGGFPDTAMTGRDEARGADDVWRGVGAIEIDS